MNKYIKTMLLSALIVNCSCDNKQQNAEFQYNDERFADIQMLRYQVEGFDSLTLQQKTFIYYLQEAALWGRDILFDQNGRHNLEIRKMMENLYQQYDGDRDSQDFKAFEEYLKR
ncbi:MAG: dihydrofolate reductase, partial [Prevotella sp.]|nr:dihydrofolate reductase [Prevotella sp.]